MENLVQQIRYILQQGVNSLTLNKESIAKQYLFQLINNLQIEHQNVRNKIQQIESELNQSKIQLSQHKQNNLKLEEYIRILKQEMNNFKQMMDQRVEQNEKKYLMLSQSSYSIIDQLTQDLERQRQTINSFRNLQKQVKNKSIIIKKLQIALTNTSQQNESLKKLVPINKVLTQQVLELQQKLKISTQLEINFRNTKEQLLLKIQQLQKSNLDLQHIINTQIIKVKQLTNQYFGNSRKIIGGAHYFDHSKQRLDSIQNPKHFQKDDNAKYLKRVQQSFINEYLMQVKAFQSHSMKNNKYDSEGISQKNDMQFQFSLDNAYQNISNHSKEIQAGSNSKGFKQQIFNINSNISSNTQKNKHKFKQTINQQINQQKQLQQMVPLSIKNFLKQKPSNRSKNQKSPITMQKNKIKTSKLSIQIPQVVTPIHSLKNSDINKQIETLIKRQQSIQAQNKKLQKQVQNLEKSKIDHIKIFQKQIYRQIGQIQQLNAQLRQQRLKKIEFQQRQQEYFRIIQDLQRLCQQFVNANIQQQQCIQNWNKAVTLLSQRLIQVQEEKWQQLQSTQILMIDQSTQTIPKQKLLSIEYTKFIHIQKKIQRNFSFLRLPDIKQFKSVKKLEFSKCTNISISQLKLKFRRQFINVIDIIISSNQKSSRSQQIKMFNVFTNTQPIIVLSLDKSVQVSLNQIGNEKLQLKHQNLHGNEIQGTQKQYLLINRIQLVNSLKQKQKQKDFMLNKQTPICSKKEFNEPFQQQQRKIEIINNSQQSSNRLQIQQTIYYSFCQESNQRLKNNLQQIQPKILENQALRENFSQNLPIFSNKQSIDKLFKQKINCVRNIPQKKEEMIQSNQIKDLLKIKQILQNQCKYLFRSSPQNLLLDISSLNLNKKEFKVDDIISNFRDHQRKIKNYFLILCMLNNNQSKVLDKVLIWKQGLISLSLQKCLIMTNAKKYVYDPVNCILGNCQIIIDLHEEAIQVKRKGKKNYFTGTMQDTSWKIIKILAIGNI